MCGPEAGADGGVAEGVTAWRGVGGKGGLDECGALAGLENVGNGDGGGDSSALYSGHAGGVGYGEGCRCRLGAERAGGFSGFIWSIGGEEGRIWAWYTAFGSTKVSKKTWQSPRPSTVVAWTARRQSSVVQEAEAEAERERRGERKRGRRIDNTVICESLKG